MEYKEEIKNCQNCKKDFTIEPDDFSFYEKIKVPPPTFCSECRMIRRMAWRNERVLYKSKCNSCDGNIISMYDPIRIKKIYCDKCWWGDKWDGIEYAVDYDFKKSFFLQWVQLLSKVPLIQAWRFNNIKSDYINYATEDKNCYLSYSVVGCENVFYSYAIDKSQDTFDSTFILKSNKCYENIDSQNNYNSIFLKNSNNCIDSGFLFDCANCQNCFLSSNLRNKKYIFKNKQFNKEEYELEISKTKINDYLFLQKYYDEFCKKIYKNAIYRFAQIINGHKCSGDNIENSKNITNSFNVYDSENERYVVRAGKTKDCMDVYGVFENELTYESIAPSFKGSNVQFSINN